MFAIRSWAMRTSPIRRAPTPMDFDVPPEIAEAIVKRLASSADIITPNAWELETLTGLPARDTKSVCAAVRSFGKTALVTSAPSPVGIGVIYASSSGAWLVETPRVPDPPKGTGDLFTALFLARRLNGQSGPSRSKPRLARPMT